MKDNSDLVGQAYVIHGAVRKIVGIYSDPDFVVVQAGDVTYPLWAELARQAIDETVVPKEGPKCSPITMHYRRPSGSVSSPIP